MNKKVLATVLLFAIVLMIEVGVVAAYGTAYNRNTVRAGHYGYRTFNTAYNMPAVGPQYPVFNARIGGGFPSTSLYMMNLRAGVETGRTSFQTTAFRNQVSGMYYPNQALQCSGRGPSIGLGASCRSANIGGYSGSGYTGFSGAPKGGFTFGGSPYY